MPVESGTKAIVLAPEPLDLDVIEEWELSPVGKAAAWALMAGSKLPIELAEVVSRGPHVRAVAGSGAPSLCNPQGERPGAVADS